MREVKANEVADGTAVSGTGVLQEKKEGDFEKGKREKSPRHTVDVLPS